jgi:hypothetical protein
MTVGIGNTKRKQARKNFDRVNPKNERFCGMCGLVVPTSTKDNYTQLSSNKVAPRIWMLHVTYVCINCNCSTQLVYTTNTNPEPIQDHIGLYSG